MLSLPLLAVTAFALGAGPNAQLAAADQAWTSGDYESVLPAVTRALKDPTISMADRSRAWELSALAHTAFDRQKEAVESFRFLLSVTPEYVPGDRVSPKVKGYFSQAQKMGSLQDPNVPARATMQRTARASDEAAEADPTVPSAVEASLKDGATRSSEVEAAPLYKKWWFWTGVGVVAAAAAGGAYAATTQPKIPSGTLGTGALQR